MKRNKNQENLNVTLGTLSQYRPSKWQKKPANIIFHLITTVKKNKKNSYCYYG